MSMFATSRIACEGCDRLLYRSPAVCPDCGWAEYVPHSFELLAAELFRAREKFPGNRFLLAALTEEVGELAQAMLQNQGVERIQHEAIQVACVAIRISEEGDSSFDNITPEESKP